MKISILFNKLSFTKAQFDIKNKKIVAMDYVNLLVLYICIIPFVNINMTKVITYLHVQLGCKKLFQEESLYILKIFFGNLIRK